MKKTAIAVMAALALTGCNAATLLDTYQDARSKGREYVGRAYAPLVLTECARSPEDRKLVLDAINARLEEMAAVERATAFDCDGDGVADF